ncbi:ABC transporter ATP-binding protein [Clostridium butyricum]|uniref:ABC transporter ATP-binding protein n=1 Tax=Clostridium butyricum TaxID=1492 RepID=UPI0028FEF1AA|nr:ABC transporter ATP-binding protein [Clostridium butyricum]
MSQIAVKIEKLSKIYRLYEKPIDRVKEALSISKKRYSKDHYALENISFEINKGETVGIIGTNGSGKSTLLKIITGVLTPSVGDVEVNGKISALLELGAGFNPEYTGVENIYLNGTMMGYSKNDMDKKVDAIVDFADIGEFINQPVKTYSSGMFARLAFAVAINVEPDILIVDEALSVGDVFFQNKCFKKFDELKKKNTTILFVSHDITSVKHMCSRVLWIEKGCQKMFGDKDKVCEAYFSDQIKARNLLSEQANVDNKNKIMISKVFNREITFPNIIIKNRMVQSEKVEIKSIFIKDENNNMVNYLKGGEVYSAHIVAEFFEAMNNIIFGFIVENNKGIQILSINSFISNNESTVNIETEGIIEAEFKFKLPIIQKGEYLISPAVAQGKQSEHIMLTWLQNASSIVIDNDGYNLSLIEIENKTEIREYERKNVEFI